MKRSILIVLALCLVIALAAGCGSSRTATTSQPVKSSAPGAVRAIDIAGPWVVQGQPEDQYYLSFIPEGTYGMKSGGAASKGMFILSGDTVTLVNTGGDRVKLKYVKGAEMMQDRLEGEVTWTRV